MKLFRLMWKNPETRTSGSMNNLAADELTDEYDTAWKRAGEGEVIMSSMPEGQVEYSA